MTTIVDFAVQRTGEDVNESLAAWHEKAAGHCAIDYERKDWKEEQLPDAPFCAGALAFMRNQCKVPRDPELAEAMGQVERDPDVFNHALEFLDHHNGGPDYDRDA